MGVQTLNRALLVLAFGPVLSGCGEYEDSKQPLFGSPTPVSSGTAPTKLACDIRQEFKNLPMPLMERMSYKGDWVRRPIVAAPTHHRGFRRVHLRGEAIAFLRSHSRLELVVSLTPLLVDPTYGGEAATLLAGIPAGTDADQGRLTRSLAQQIYDSGYRSPNQGGTWHRVAHASVASVAPLYGLSNTTSRIHARHVREYAGSLEEAIVRILKSHGALTPSTIQSLYEPYENPPLQGDLREWAQGRPAPDLTGRAREFVQQHPGPFAAMALLPLSSTRGSSLSVSEHLLMWLLDSQEEYWPAMLRRASGNKLAAPLTKAFRREAAQRVLALCEQYEQPLISKKQ